MAFAKTERIVVYEVNNLQNILLIIHVYIGLNLSHKYLKVSFIGLEHSNKRFGRVYGEKNYICSKLM